MVGVRCLWGASALVFALVAAGVAFAAPSVAAGPGTVVINEVMYNPGDGVPGDAEFVEFHNPGNTDVNLNGYTFDDENSAVNGDTVTLSGTLTAGSYAIISRDGFDAVAEWGVVPIATMDFGLSGSGELLTVSDGGGNVVDAVDYGVSAPWPSTPDGDGPSLELIDPMSDNSIGAAWAASDGGETPGAVNSATTAPPPPISSVTATPFSPTASQAITVVATIPNIFNDPMLRWRANFDSEQAIAMKDNGVAPDVTAGDDVYTAQIPGQAAGDLVRYRVTTAGGEQFPDGDGREYEGVVVANPLAPPTGLVTLDWFIEDDDYDSMFDDPEDETVIVEGSVLAIDGVVYDNMEVKIRGGGYARINFEKQGLSFDFASGVEVLNPDLVPYAIDEFALNAERGWTWGRPLTAWQLFYEAGYPTVHAQHVRVERNGEFYGMFRFTEKLDGTWRDQNDIDGDFYKAADPASYDDPEVGFEKKQGDENDFSSLNELALYVTDNPSSAKTNYLYDNLDIPTAVNFIAVANLVQHFDSEYKNYYLHEDGSTGLWEIYPWDLSNAFGVPNGGEACQYGAVLELNCRDNDLWNSINEVPVFRAMVFRRMRTLIDGPMADGKLETLFNQYDPSVSAAERAADLADWSEMDPYNTPGKIDREVDYRRDLALASPDLPGSQPAIPNVVITELVHSANNGPDWLELHNPTNASIDMSGWELDGADLTMPGGTVLLPGAYLVATSSVPDFQAAYPNLPNVVLVEFDGGLSGGGEQLQLVNATGDMVDLVDYIAGAPWPTEPSAGVFSLSLFQGSPDNSIFSAWGRSAGAGGTPGAANVTVPSAAEIPPEIVINEIHYNPQSPTPAGVEFIELINPGSAPADVGGWELGGFSGTETVLPTGTEIPAQGYLVLTPNASVFASVYPGVSALQWAAGALSNDGEPITLETGDGYVVDTVTYDEVAPWPTTPNGAGPSLELIDPASDNALAASWRASFSAGGSPGASNTPNCASVVFTVNLAAGDSPTAGDDVILGTPGDDVIVALGGNDIICGGGGDDTINAGPGSDWVDAGPGNDVVYGLDGSDIINGGTGNDDLISGNGNDTIDAGPGDDTVNGGPGNDIVSGRAGNDTVYGQSGDDVIEGHNGDDLILGVDGSDTINGGSGADLINGGPGDDVLTGGAGNDTIFGLSGNDTLNGGNDDDTVFGQVGDDIINGGLGNDDLLGNGGNDTITDPGGTNTINGGPGNDTLTGGSGNDSIYGDGDVAQAGDDIIDGGGGQDLLIGFAGADTITADDGIADTVNGGPNVDSCTTDGIDTVFNCP